METRDSKLCRAKDPRKCRYHGAVLRMEQAARKSDLDAYFEARTEVEKQEVTGLAYEEIQSLTGKEINTKLTTDIVTKAIEKYSDANPSRYGTRLSNLIDKLSNQAHALERMEKAPDLELPNGVGKINYVDGFFGEEDGSSRVWVVFEAGGRYFRITGTYSSWDATEWYPEVEEVKIEKTIKTRVEARYTII